MDTITGLDLKDMVISGPSLGSIGAEMRVRFKDQKG